MNKILKTKTKVQLEKETIKNDNGKKFENNQKQHG